jgi:teichuronic acid biosynthesis glycosyltransferase TuaG
MVRQPTDYIQGLVSVITPVYNCEKYLDRTLQSVFAQTYKNIEIVLVDDQSTDRSAEIIKRYQETHPEIVYFLQPQNMGAGHARNKALELAKGQYVAFLDADDVWKPVKIEKQVELLQRKKGGFCFAAIEMIDGDDKLIKGKRSVKEEIDYKFLLSNTMIPTSGVMIDRTIKGDFRMHLRRGGQDYATWLSLLRDGSKAFGIDEALVGYRIDGQSLSSNKMKSIRQIWKIQTQDEGIGMIAAVWHIGLWCWNSVKKYWM